MNLLLLEYIIKKRGFTNERFCRSLGMNQVTFYNKRNGITEFTWEEMQNIVTVLDLDFTTARRIFFG